MIRSIGLTVILTAALAQAQVSQARLSFQPVAGAARVERADEVVQAFRYVDAEHVYALLYKRLSVRRMNFVTGQSDSIRFGPFPEMNSAHIVGDLDADANHSIYIPITWRNASRQTQAGVAVFRTTGEHVKTINLTPPLNIRPIAVHPSGRLFVLGTPPECFKGRNDRCLLVHEYSPDGLHVRSFSEATPQVLPRGSSAAPEAFRDLLDEADRGRLWIQDGLLHQLLPLSQMIRSYNFDGTLAAEKKFVAPGPGRFMARNVFLLDGGRSLVDWVHAPAADSGGSRGIALHDSTGHAVTRLHGAADALPMPIACRPSGDCVVVTGPSKSGGALTSARLEIQ